jgi:hypothetical protein
MLFILSLPIYIVVVGMECCIALLTSGADVDSHRCAAQIYTTSRKYNPTHQYKKNKTIIIQKRQKNP